MFKIGELSEITGVSVQAIRFYEREGLIKPVEVDRWTNYRYYDKASVCRLAEISQLKNLGFSLSDIKNFDEEKIKEKIIQSKLDIEKLIKNINKLSTIKKIEGEFIMKTFINDDKVIGKWHKVGVVKSKNDYKENKFTKENIFDFKDLYFLPNGEEYWVFSWTKGTLFVKGNPMPYEIIGDKLFVSVVDSKNGVVDDYAVYEKIDDKKYHAKDIQITDNTNLEFINDSEVIGFWEVVDYVNKISDFNVGKKFTKAKLFLKKYTFEPNGIVIGTYGEEADIAKLNWTKNVLINNENKTACEYLIKEIDKDKYMFIEWKSGDYTFGGKINGYYVLKQNQ